jgi:hypothetical protein
MFNFPRSAKTEFSVMGAPVARGGVKSAKAARSFSEKVTPKLPSFLFPVITAVVVSCMEPVLITPPYSIGLNTGHVKNGPIAEIASLRLHR